MHQASALVGVAIANRLPQLSLTAQYGSIALTPAALFTPATAVWSVGAAGTQPIFHGFTLLHQERAAKAAYEMADAQYRNTVLTAFQNVADALRALQLDAATLKAQQRATRAASDTFDLSRGQYRLGAITYVTLLNAERSYEQARLALVQAQAARYADTAALFAGARRRLVEPQRCGAGSVQPRAATRPSRQRYRRPQQRSSIDDQTHGDHAHRSRHRVRWNLRIPGVQGVHDQEIHDRHGFAAADRVRDQGRLQRMAAEARSDRHVARREGRRSVARRGRRRRFDLVQFRRRRRGGRAAAEAARGR